MAEECVALCDYIGGEGELSFKTGEVITVLAKGTDSGFWEGISQSDGHRGLFPNCMVTSNLNPGRCGKLFLNKAVALFDHNARGEKEMSFSKHDLITCVRPAEQSGWWWGVNETKRREALMPSSSNNNKSLSETTDENNTSLLALAKQRASASTSQFKNVAAVGNSFYNPETSSVNKEEEEKQWLRLFPSNFVNCNIVLAAYPFQARFRHELSMSLGDVVMVHRRWNDGWWEGSLPVKADDGEPPKAANGDAPIVVGGRRRGMFPSNYTIANVPTTEPALFCPKCRTVYAASSMSKTECKECNANEVIVRTMMRTLQEHDDLIEQGEVDPDEPVDLFEHIDLDPRKGPGSLLRESDVKEITVRPVGSVPRTDNDQK